VFTPNIRRWGGLLAGLGLLIALVVLASVFGDMQTYRHLWGGLRGDIVALIFGLAILNHGLRYWRWERLTARVATVEFKRRAMLPVYLAGSVFIFTPGRLGEAVKSVYAREYCGVPVSASVPVLVIERVADVLVMTLLAGTGLLLQGERASLMAGGIVVGVALLLLVSWRPLLGWFAARRFVTAAWRVTLTQIIDTAQASQRSLLRPSALGTNLALGTSAWMLEIMIFYLALVALGVSPGIDLYIFALAAFPLASLGGSLSFLPAGLGVTEGGLAVLAIFLGGLSPETAVFAAFLARAAILGVVLLTGLPALLRLARR
jgi:glycosyltransferase 2 family protein